MTERELFESIRDAAKRFGWLLAHHYDSRRTEAGVPDCILIRDRVLWRELKVKGGKLTPAQVGFHAALRQAGQDVGVWREANWPDRIIAELR